MCTTCNDRPLEFPPGKLGDVAHYLWRYAASPVEEYAIATSIGFFAGICGRGWIYSGTGLNHDIVVLGLSGSGKNIIHQGIQNIVKQLDGTPIRSFIINQQMASAPALLKHVAANPCSLQLIGEIGKMYRAYSKSRFGDNIDQLFTAKLDLWERSGPDGASVGIKYSDSEKNVDGGVIAGIAHSTIGESQPEVFYGALSTDNMNEGLLSRLWIFEYMGDDPEFSSDRSERLPEELRNYLRGLVLEASKRVLGQQPIECSPEAKESFQAFLMECNTEKAMANNPAVRQLWVRAYEKVLRLAGLCAVADNYACPVIKREHADWAILMLSQTNTNILNRIGDDIADDTDHSREQMILDRCRRWLTTPRKIPKDQDLASNGIVSRRFLQQEVASKEIFRKHRLGAVSVFNLTMRSLVDQGFLAEVKKEEAAKFGVFGQCWRVLELKGC